MYRSVLSPPWEPIEASDFRDAPHLILNEIFDAKEKPDERALDLWNRYIRHSPADVYNLYAGGFGREDIRLDVSVAEGGEIKFNINEGGDNGFLSSLWIILNSTPVITHSKIYVEPEAQGRGIGRVAMANKVETAAALGFDLFPFDAALDNGGHAWARMGAHLDRDEDRLPFYKDHEEQLSLCLTARLEAARPYIGKDNYDKAFTLCQLQRPDDLVTLSRMGDLVVPKTVLNEIGTVLPRVYYSSIGDGFSTDTKVEFEIKRLSSMFYESASGRTDYVRFPHFMQNKTEWSAVFDFSNDAQMESVGNYIGGWRTMEQVPAHRLAVA